MGAFISVPELCLIFSMQDFALPTFKTQNIYCYLTIEVLKIGLLREFTPAGIMTHSQQMI